MADSLLLNIADLPESRDLAEELRKDMVDHGFNPPVGFLFDGKIHRFGRDNVCWYIGYSDDYPCAQYCDWSVGEVHSVKVFETSILTVEERAAYEAKLADIKRQREEVEELGHREAAAKAKASWNYGRPMDPNHPYILKKKIRPKSECRMASDGRLMLPVYDEAGDIVSLQYINENGDKRFLPGGKMKGSYGYISGEGQTFLCEGWATAESIHEATGAEVFFSFSANNLKAVGEVITRAGKVARIVADNDESGTGEKYAKASGLDYVLIPVVGMDANDYYTSGGNLKALLHKDKGYKTLSEFLKTGNSVDWLIKDVLPSGDYGMMYGASGAGKSFYALSMMCAIANHSVETWNGHKLKHRGICVYLVGEGVIGVRMRLAALMHYYGYDEMDLENLVIIDDLSADLDRAEGVLKLKERLEEIRTDLGLPICLLVVDTLNVFYSGDENSSQDARAFNTNMNAIMHDYGCTCMPITHTGVSADASKRIRGSSAFRGNLGFELLVEQNKDTKFVRLSSTKSKDTDGFVPMTMKIESIDLGYEDEDGDRVSAGTLVPVSQEEVTRVERDEVENKLIQESWELVRKTFSKHPHQREDGTPYLVANELAETICKAKGWKERTAKKYFRDSTKVIGVLVGIGALSIVNDVINGQLGIRELEVRDCLEAESLNLAITRENRKLEQVLTPCDRGEEYISPIYPPESQVVVRPQSQPSTEVRAESQVEDPFPPVEKAESWEVPDYE